MNRRRGSIALEYILIAALVAIALIATLQMWRRSVADAVGTVTVDSHGALEAP